jgi:hypothetical protein
VNISSRPVRVALASGAALIVVGAASAGVALFPSDTVSPESKPRMVGEVTTAPAQGMTQRAVSSAT